MSPGRAINCNHVLDLLDNYRRGKLLPGQKQVIADHLQSCSACTAELEAREAIALQMLAALPKAAAPQVLSPTVLAAIKAAARHDDPRPRRNGSPLLPIMLTAAAVLVFAVAMYQLKQPTTAEAPTIAANFDTAPFHRERPSAVTSEPAMEAPPVDSEISNLPAAAPGAVPEATSAKAATDALGVPQKSADKQLYDAPASLSAPPPSAPMGVASEALKSEPAAIEGTLARRQSLAGAAAEYPVQSRYLAQDAAVPEQHAQKSESAQAAPAIPPAMPVTEERKLRFFAKEAPATTASLSTSTLATTAPSSNTTATTTATSPTTLSREIDRQ